MGETNENLIAFFCAVSQSIIRPRKKLHTGLPHPTINRMSVGRPKKSLEKYSSKTRDNQNASKGAPMPTSPRRNIVSFLLFAVLLQNISFAMAITPTVSLQTPHPPMSPAQTMHDLAENCAALNVGEWDVYGDFEKPSSWLRQFEADLAEEFGKEDAVFMPSGTMAQSIALLIHSKSSEKKRFACHATSHLLLHENEGFQELCKMSAVALPEHKANRHLGLDTPPLLYQDLVDADLSDVSTLMLELPHRELGGKLTPWEEILKMEELLKKKGISFHCDGARLFEATTGYGKSPSELAEPFDSVYISFYKGLGGMAGAMLMGSKDFCDEARVWLRRFGGNLYTLLPYAVSGWSGYQKYWKEPNEDGNKTMLSFQEKKEKLVRICEHLSADENFAKVVKFEPQVPKVSMVHW